MAIGPALTSDRVLALAQTTSADALALETGMPAEWYGGHDRYLMPPPPPPRFWCDPTLSGRPVAEAAQLADLQRAIDKGETLEQADFLDYMRLRGLADLYFFAKHIGGCTLLDRKFHGALAWAWQAPNGWQTPWGQVYRRSRWGAIARGHYKTTLLTQMAAAWDAIRDVEQRILIYTHSIEFSISVMSVIKDLCEGVGHGADLFLYCYGDRIPAEQLRGKKVKWDQQNLTFVRQGRYTDPTIYGGAVDAKIAGRHFTKEYVDDLVVQQLSRTLMAKVLQNLDNLTPLYVSLKTGERRMVGTPWAFYDPLSYTERYDKGSMVARVPWRKPDGALTIPTCDVEEALRLKRKNAWFFSCQFEVWPKAEGQIGFQREWFRYFKYVRKPEGACIVPIERDGSDGKPVRLAECNVFVLIDPNTGRVPGERVSADANAPKERAHDFAGFIVLAIDKDSNRYVMRAIRWRCNPRELMDKTFELVNIWRPKFVGLEQIAAQRLFVFLFQEEFRKGRPPFSIRPWQGGHASKEERIKGLIPIAENGMLWFREPDREAEAQGIMALEGELEDFPNAEFDDLSDALSAHLGITYAPGEQQGKQLDDVLHDISLDAKWARLGPFARAEAEAWERKKRRGVVTGDAILAGASTLDYEDEDEFAGLVGADVLETIH